MKKIITLLSISFLALLGMARVCLSADIDMTITPATVEISAFYNGTSAIIKGRFQPMPKP